MNVTIRVIPHEDQRYKTCGDWFYGNGDLVVCVSDTGDWRSNTLVAVHELVEALLCKDVISQEAVDKFDMEHPELDDPGDDPRAPYQFEHCFATSVERMLAAALKYPWRLHEERLSKLDGG